MTGVLAALVKKYGPLGLALAALAYLLYNSERRADADRAWLMNELGQDIADVRAACQGARP